MLKPHRHNEPNPTIPFHLSHEDCDIHMTHISKNHEIIRIVESSSGNIYTLKWTLSAMKRLPRAHKYTNTWMHAHVDISIHMYIHIYIYIYIYIYTYLCITCICWIKSYFKCLEMFIFWFGKSLHAWQWMPNTMKLVPQFHFSYCIKILISTSHIHRNKHGKIRIVESSSGNVYIH